MVLGNKGHSREVEIKLDHCYLFEMSSASDLNRQHAIDKRWVHIDFFAAIIKYTKM